MFQVDSHPSGKQSCKDSVPLPSSACASACPCLCVQLFDILCVGKSGSRVVLSLTGDDEGGVGRVGLGNHLVKTGRRGAGSMWPQAAEA